MADVCRKYGISYAAVYKYKTTYGGVIGTLVECHYTARQADAERFRRKS